MCYCQLVCCRCVTLLLLLLLWFRFLQCSVLLIKVLSLLTRMAEV
jgi:hypothetical protein